MGIIRYFNGQYDIYEVRHCIADALYDIRRRAPEGWMKKRVVEILENHILNIEDKYFAIKTEFFEDNAMILSCDIDRDIYINRDKYFEMDHKSCLLMFSKSPNYPEYIKISINHRAYYKLSDCVNNRFVGMTSDGADTIIWVRDNRVSSFNIAEYNFECGKYDDRIRVVLK